MNNTNYPKTVNEVKNAYTYYLEEKMPKIWGMMMNDKVSIEAMRHNIFNYIWNAKSYYIDDNGNTVEMKKVDFLANIDRMTSKKSIYFYCKNSVKRAKATFANLAK